jgi:hypothetical protein
LHIKTDGDLADAKAEDNPNALVAIIHRAHFAHVDSASPAVAKVFSIRVVTKLEQGPAQYTLFRMKVFVTLMQY